VAGREATPPALPPCCSGAVLEQRIVLYGCVISNAPALCSYTTRSCTHASLWPGATSVLPSYAGFLVNLNMT
jgi:hypothetical protein